MPLVFRTNVITYLAYDYRMQKCIAFRRSLER